MRRLADLHPGSAKTDARDAYVIADAARTAPHALRKMGRSRVDRELAKAAPRIHGRLSEQIFDGLDAQSVVVPGTAAAERVLPGLAAQLQQLLDERERMRTLLPRS